MYPVSPQKYPVLPNILQFLPISSRTHMSRYPSLPPHVATARFLHVLTHTHISSHLLPDLSPRSLSVVLPPPRVSHRASHAPIPLLAEGGAKELEAMRARSAERQAEWLTDGGNLARYEVKGEDEDWDAALGGSASQLVSGASVSVKAAASAKKSKAGGGDKKGGKRVKRG